MDKNRILFVFLIVIVIALLIGASSAFSLFGKQKTQLNITNNDTISQNDNITINLTTDKGDAISNATINVTIKTDDGKNETKSVVTNESGIATFKFENESGKYVINCTYDGNDDNEACNAVQNLTVKEVEVEDSGYDDSNYDYGAFYSAQEGRVIYTGEIHSGPDGHRYRHLGYNEWQQID